ncbi:hypothetical protein [Paraburkholderia phytofirmans]|nr:hypothetical protein [Paraburkholderia phytofirmans]
MQMHCNSRQYQSRSILFQSIHEAAMSHVWQDSADRLTCEPVASINYARMEVSPLIHPETSDVWFIADWQLYHPDLDGSRIAIVLDVLSGENLFTWFRDARTPGVPWVLEALGDLSRRRATPDLLVTTQDRLFPSLVIAATRFKIPARAELDISYVNANSVRRCIGAIFAELSRNFAATSDALALDASFQRWRNRFNESIEEDLTVS